MNLPANISVQPPNSSFAQSVSISSSDNQVSDDSCESNLSSVKLMKQRTIEGAKEAFKFQVDTLRSLESSKLGTFLEKKRSDG